jgi:2-(1,2-epoxy-1,2-dihydrophenyl)acetyl-CoA isomerase
LPTQAHRLIPLVLETQVPVVCAVRGWAAGLGFQLALAADFCIASKDARFWAPFGQRGFTPDSGATWLLPRRVGDVRARELLMLGRTLSGEDAAAWGAIHRAVPDRALDGEIDMLVDQLATGPTVALGLTKWLLHQGRAVPLADQLANEAFALELSSRTEDFREGMNAFREKRPPEFRGR